MPSGVAPWQSAREAMEAAVPIRSELDPNDYAPVSGRYELLNPFGAETGDSVFAREGEQLPPVPCGYSWMQHPSDCIGARRDPAAAAA